MSHDDDTTPNEQEDAAESTETEGAQQSAAAPVEEFAETFKTAAQKVLEERFGMAQNADGSVDFTKIDGDKVKENAQALITGLMSQLAGITPAPGDSEEPKKSTRTPATSDDNVIDLESARRAREPRAPSDLELRMSDNLKTTFNRYVQENLVPDGASGQVKLNVDGEMLRDHGPQMLTALFGAFTKSLFPEGGVEVDLSSNAPEENAEQTEAHAGDDAPESAEEGATEPSQEGSEGGVDVKLNVDVAGLFQSLIGGITPKK